MTLNELRDAALANAIAKGFTETRPAEDIALMHSELSEALEELRNGHTADTRYVSMKEIVPGMPDKPLGVPSEMADVIIRVLHFCGKHGIDIEAAVKEKMAFNAFRPFRHGKEF